MKKLTYLILTILILILIVIFTLQNTNEININLFFWDIKTSLALLIFSLFALGVIVALVFLTPIIIAHKSTLKKDEKIIFELQEAADMYSKKQVEKE
jgi:uncharacterized integral membrane protein